MFLDKKTRSRVSVNEELAEKLYKPVIKTFKRRKVYARFKDLVWARDLAEMWSLSFKNKKFQYLLCVIDFFAKYGWVKPLKDKKCKTILIAFIEIVNESNHKPNKLQVDQKREFYHKVMQEWLSNNYILIYFTHNEGKSGITERFIKVSKAKIYKKWQLMIVNITLVTWIN